MRYRRELHLQVLQNLRSGCIWRDWSQIIVVGQAWLVMTLRTLVLCATQEGSFQVRYPSGWWIRHGSLFYLKAFSRPASKVVVLGPKGWNSSSHKPTQFKSSLSGLELQEKFCVTIQSKQWASQALHPSWQLWFLRASTIVLVRTRLTDLFLFENALSHHVHEIEMPIPSHLVAQGAQTCNICRIPCYLRMELFLPGLNPASRQNALDAESSKHRYPSTAHCRQAGTRLLWQRGT